MAKVLSAILLGISVLLLGIAAVLTIRTLSWSSAETTTGTVVEVHYHAPEEDEDGPTWSFTVEWSDNQGNTHSTHSGYSTSKPPAVGDQVPVQYYPDDPDRARISTWAGRWLAATIVGGIGAVFSLVSVIFAIAMRKQPWRLPPEMPPSPGGNFSRGFGASADGSGAPGFGPGTPGNPGSSGTPGGHVWRPNDPQRG